MPPTSISILTQLAEMIVLGFAAALGLAVRVDRPREGGHTTMKSRSYFGVRSVSQIWPVSSPWLKTILLRKSGCRLRLSCGRNSGVSSAGAPVGWVSIDSCARILARPASWSRLVGHFVICACNSSSQLMITTMEFVVAGSLMNRNRRPSGATS